MPNRKLEARVRFSAPTLRGYTKMRFERLEEREEGKGKSPKGMRDFLPKEKIIRNYIVETLKEIFEDFGYNPIETPAIESLNTLTAKGGITRASEAYQEIYKLKDRANRQLGLKFDQTVPLARVIASNPQLPRPFKRYQIDRAWRDGPTKMSRYREFWQADIDVVGPDSMIADAEVLAVISAVFKKLGLDVVIKISNRKFLNGILKYCDVPEEQRMSAIISIDKLEKIGAKGVITEARSKRIDEKSMEDVLSLLEKNKIEEFEKINNEEAKQGLGEIKELLQYAKEFDVKNVVFAPYLARGLEYYTGTIVEVYSRDKKGPSLAAGGRYDGMIGEFTGTKKTVPAVGVGFGLDTIYDTLVAKRKVKLKETVVDVFVIPIGKEKVLKEALSVVDKLRVVGINTDIDIMQRSPSKNLNYASKQKIPFVLLIGEKEIALKKVKLRNMKTGKEELLSVKQLSKKLKS